MSPYDPIISIILAIFAITPLVSAHLVMIEPTPFALTCPESDYGCSLLQVNPLGTNYPFPCQGPQRTSVIVNSTRLTAGSSQLVRFQGSAVHGGGSCQFSINYGDANSANPSDWRVLYTIIGGCPASAAGNLETTGSDASGRVTGPQCGDATGTECMRQFEIPIPKGLKNGNATFAWTWFNKMGNREMYMNCAPVEVVGGGEDDAFVNGLPVLFKANVEDEPCITGEGVLNIPDIGSRGLLLEQPASGAIGSCNGGTNPPAPSFDAGGASPTTSTSLAPSQMTSVALGLSSATPSPPVASETTPTGVYFLTAPPSAAPTSTTLLTIIMSRTVVQTATAVHTTFATVSSVVTAPTADSGGGADTCDSTKVFWCIDSAHFGTCANGQVVSRPVAPGTACLDDQIQRMDDVVERF